MDCPTNYIYETTRCVCNFITYMILTARCTYRKYIRSILQHFTLNLEVGLNILHICVFFICSFYFARYWSWARPPGVQTMCPINFAARSNRSLFLQFVSCILVFYILYFICNLYFLLVLQQKLKLHLFCNHYFCITSNLQQLIITCGATVLGDSFRSRFQMSESRFQVPESRDPGV